MATFCLELAVERERTAADREPVVDLVSGVDPGTEGDQVGLGVIEAPDQPSSYFNEPPR